MQSIKEDYRIIYRLIVIFGIVLLGGIVIIIAINNTGKSVAHNMQMLVDDQLPKVDTIHSLQTEIKRLELVLYRYYETTDSDVYQRASQQTQAQIDSYLSTLDSVFVASIEAYLQKLQLIANKFDAEIRSQGIDWNLLRDYLAGSRQVSDNLDGMLHQKALALRKSSQGYAKNTQAIIAKMILTQVMFSGLVLVLLLIVGFVLNRQLRQHFIHRELALYPEQNPQPILRFSMQGKALYLNPAAVNLATALNVSNDPLQLLPADYQQKIPAQLTLSAGYESDVYPLGDSVYSVNFHHLQGDRAFYAYLMDVTDRAKAEQELIYQSAHDLLTNLPNRRKLDAILQQKTQSSLKPFSLLLLKVSRLDLINASLGHEMTDRLFVAISQRLTSQKKQQNANITIFAFEPGSWVVIDDDTATAAIAKQHGEALLNEFIAPIQINDSEFNLRCHIGITLYPQGGCSAQELLRNADAALRQGVSENRTIRLYSEDLTQQAIYWLKLEQGLKQALNKQQFSFNIQPKVDARTGNFAGGEALIRWQHDNNWISPAEFIPIAEDSGLINAIGAWVLTAACQQWVSWQQAGLHPKRLAVNVSAQQFMQPDFVEFVADTLMTTGMHATALELEITEAVASEQPEKIIHTMNRLKKLGVHLAIDDFGTGYSSLSYLRRFPVNTLKIDRSFVSTMETSENSAAIVRMILSLAKELKLKVVAEGVENAVQQRLLADLGCDLLQGFYFFKPLTIKDYQALLAMQPRD